MASNKNCCGRSSAFSNRDQTINTLFQCGDLTGCDINDLLPPGTSGDSIYFDGSVWQIGPPPTDTAAVAGPDANNNFTVTDGDGNVVTICGDPAQSVRISPLDPCLLEILEGCGPSATVVNTVSICSKVLKACNDVGGCWPAAPTAPDPASLALLPAPFYSGYALTELFGSGTLEWTYDADAMSWGTPCRFPHSGTELCHPNLGTKIQFNPMPTVPTDIPGVTLPTDARPGDVLPIHGLNGFIRFKLGDDCTTWTVCGSMCFEDPAIRIAGTDCCATPPVVDLERIQGKTGLHNLLVALKAPSGAVLAYADETPQAAAPDFASGTSFTFTGQTLEDGYIICAQIWSGTQDGSGNLDTTAADSVVVASHEMRVERFVFEIAVNDGPNIPLMCDSTGYVIDGDFVVNDIVIDGEVVYPQGTPVTSQADIDAFLATTAKAGANFCPDTCSYCFVAPLFAAKCPPVITISALAPCVTVDGASDSCNNFQNNKITANPEAPTDGNYEHSVQISTDGGSTWVDPDSLLGGEVWIPWDGTPYCPAFEFPLAPGTIVRNCLRRVGSTDVLYDTKQVPDPQITDNGTSVVLANAASEPNPCLDHANDVYVLTVNAFDGSGAMVEVWTSPGWTPATATIDLSGAPTDISAALSLGADGYTVNVNAGAMTTATQLEYALAIEHVYDCP